MKLYRVATYRDNYCNFITEDRNKAEKDFNDEVEYINNDDADIDDDYVKLIKIDLQDFGENYQTDLDLNDQLDDVAKVIKEATWKVGEDGYIETCVETIEKEVE